MSSSLLVHLGVPTTTMSLAAAATGRQRILHLNRHYHQRQWLGTNNRLLAGVSSSSHPLKQQQVRCYRSLFVNPPVDENPTLTTIDIMSKFSSDIGQAREYSKSGLEETLRQRSTLMEFLPASVDELPPRRMADSFVSAVIPLRSRADIRERYVTFEGNVRVGRVLEDMDVFSVFCCFQHISNPRSAGKKNPYSIVTALVDSIHVANDAVRNDEDIRLSGHVSYVGRSSLEVSLVLDQRDSGGKYAKVCEAVFLMVARDPMNTGPAIVNPLVADTPQEQSFIDAGKERQLRRKVQESESLYRVAPTKDELEIIHSRFLQNWGEKTSGDVNTGKHQQPWVNMVDTKLKTVFICHPQYRNRYNKIFGGFIMRQATEIAFTNAFIYAKLRPYILNIDDVLFRRPVEIGSILRFSAHVGYVENEFIHCPVKAEVFNPRTNQFLLSNMFHFTFKTKPPSNANLPPTLNFHTYQEGIEYLASRRHFRKMMDEFVLKKKTRQDGQ